MKPIPILGAIAALFLLFLLMRTDNGYEIRNAEPTGETIVCFGDSLTYGTGAAKGMDYPSQLSRLIGRPVVNLGVPGNTTADALARIDAVIEQRPRMVLLTLGGNDLRKKMAKEQAFANLRTLVERVQAQGALVVIGGIEVPLFGQGYGDGYRQLARETGSLLVPNVFEGIMGNTSLMSDPIHPNGEGYGLMAEMFQQAIEPYLSP